LDLKTNVIVESIHDEFIKNKFISDPNMQEPNLKVITPSSALSELVGFMGRFIVISIWSILIKLCPPFYSKCLMFMYINCIYNLKN
jgi:hypothetical protein